jgi:autotransporter-associated beta strand protein
MLDVNGVMQTIGSLTGPAGSAITLGNGQLTAASAVNSQFDGNISGASGALTKSGSGALTLGGNNSYTGVTTITGGALVLNGAGAQNPVLSGAGGADLKSGKLLLDYTGGSDPIGNVQTILGNSYVSNFASGQIRSSNTQDIHKGIGYFDNTGVSQVSLVYTYYGDANLDGQVNSADFTALAMNFNTAGGAMWQQGDFNFDGFVNALDFNAIASNFGAAPIASSVLGALVPEPTSLGFVILGSAMIVARRRRTEMES